MSLLDPIVPYLGPLGPALAVSGTLVVILGLIGIGSFMLYKVKRDIFETSVAGVGATRSALKMGDYPARFRRFLKQGQKGKKGGAGGTELPPEKSGFSYFTYGLLGRRIAKILPLFSGLKQVLSLAGMKIGYKAYVSSMIFSALLGGGLSFFVWFFLFTFGLGSALGLGGFSIISILGTLLLSIVFSFITGAAILGFFYILPSMKVGSRRQRLDTYLPL